MHRGPDNNTCTEKITFNTLQPKFGLVYISAPLVYEVWLCVHEWFGKENTETTVLSLFLLENNQEQVNRDLRGSQVLLQTPTGFFLLSFLA